MQAPQLTNRPTNRRGFTLIELLLVCVIIGVLSAVAIPKFRGTKDRAIRVKLAADLRNLTTSQESYFEDHGEYADDVAKLAFRGSAGNTITVEERTLTGWSASATHPALAGPCTITYGDAAPLIAGVPPNQVACVE